MAADDSTGGKRKKREDGNHYEKMTKQTVKTLDTWAKEAATNPNWKVMIKYDDWCPGLYVRVARQGAVWYLRGRLGKGRGKPTRHFRVAPLRRDDDPDVIRDRVAEAKKIMGQGLSPADYLHEAEVGGPVVRHFDAKRDGWTWIEARDEFLAAHKYPVLAKATHDGYRRTLHSERRQDFRAWEKKLVKEITKADVQALQRRITDSGRRAQAGLVTRTLGAMFAWVVKQGASGLTENPMIGVDPLNKSKTEKALYREARIAALPTLKDVGEMAWLLDSPKCNSAARLAAMLCLLTSLRRETIIAAEKREFHPTLDGGLWRIPAPHMKSKRPFVMVLPPLAWRVVQYAMRISGDSPLLWPQQRLRRAGDAGDKHMSAKVINETLGNAGTPIRPHACRAVMTTYGEQHLGFAKSRFKRHP